MEKSKKKIRWTDPAMMDLLRIFEYVENTLGFDAADNLSNKIIAKTDILVDFPELGTIEQELKNRVITFRYLIEGYFKIIYHVEENLVKIDYVFDTRQNPKNLKE